MLEAWLRLIHLGGIGLPAKRQLLEHLGNPEAVLALPASRRRELAAAFTGRAPSQAAKNPPLTGHMARRDAAILRDLGADFIPITDPRYPECLRQVDLAPIGLFTLGDVSLLGAPQVALVGSRHASHGGLQTAARFAVGLVRSGVTVTSGLALGIDAGAHRGALDCGGNTVAVIANGLEREYPRRNRTLQREIASRGLLVTEFPPGTEPRRGNFPRRNRIISGLSRATVVIEAGLKSGSLITARLAAEQGREVFAVPGSIYAPGSRGCHYLLRQGAALAESADDVLAEIGIATPGNAEIIAPVTRPMLEGDTGRVFALLDHAPRPLDQLIECSGLTADQVSSILIRLELQGLVLETGGGYQCLPLGKGPEPTRKYPSI